MPKKKQKEKFSKSISIKIDAKTAERFKWIEKMYGIKPPKLVKDCIESFLPTVYPTNEFITHSGAVLMVQKAIPLRGVLPYCSALMGFNYKNFTIEKNGVETYIDPYPDYSMLCKIKMIERLYQATKINGAVCDRCGNNPCDCVDMHYVE